jgi:hypothetical protein
METYPDAVVRVPGGGKFLTRTDGEIYLTHRRT